MKKSTIVTIIIIVLVIAGLFSYFRPANHVKILEVKVSQVQKGTLSKIVTASGNIQPERVISLTIEKGDIVKEILKHVGDEVKKDDVLIKFENDYELKSPIDGKVLTLDVVEGQRMQLSLSLPTVGVQQMPVISLADFDPMVAEVVADEKDIKDILKDQKVSLTLDAYPEKLLSGKVKEVGMALVTGAEGTQGHPVKIEIRDAQGISPRQGLSVDAEITTQTRESTLYVSYEAVFEEDGKPFVFKIQDDLAQKTEVKIGLETDDYYEIISGLKEGEQIIVSDLDELVRGQKVKIK